MVVSHFIGCVSILVVMILSIATCLIDEDLVPFHKYFGGKEGKLSCSSVVVSDDGDIFTSGYLEAEVQTTGFWITKLDKTGEIDWNFIFSKTGERDSCYSSTLSHDGHVLVTGIKEEMYEFVVLMKLRSSDGEVLWTRSIKEDHYQMLINSVISHPQTGDIIIMGGIYVNGTLRKKGVFWKFNSSGDYLGSKLFGDVTSKTYFTPSSAIVTSDGGFIVSSSANGISGTPEIYYSVISKWNFDMIPQWSFFFGDNRTNLVIKETWDVEDVIETSSGDILAVGYLTLVSPIFTVPPAYCTFAYLFQVSPILSIKFEKRYCSDVGVSYGLLIYMAEERDEDFSLFGHVMDSYQKNNIGPLIIRISKLNGSLLSAGYTYDNSRSFYFTSSAKMGGESLVVLGSSTFKGVTPRDRCLLILFPKVEETCNIKVLETSMFTQKPTISSFWGNYILLQSFWRPFVGTEEYLFDTSIPEQFTNTSCVSCFGVSNDNVLACSGHGICIDDNLCECENPYPGEQCQLYTCWGISSNNHELVCGNNKTKEHQGFCAARDVCLCNRGYFSLDFGKECSEYFCGDINWRSPDVCSGHGKCMSSQNCQCYDDFEGDFCGAWSCGSLYTKKSTCSGHGSCTAPDTCECDSGFGGELCQENLMVYTVMIPVLTSSSVIFLVFLVLLCICCLVLCIFLCCVLLFLLVLTVGITGLSLAQKKRLSIYGKLEGFDVHLHEQLLEKDATVAHLKINKDLFEIPYEEIKIDKMIGKGGSDATVFVGTWKGETIAFKCFKTRRICSSQEKFDLFEAEVNLLVSLNHPNIIRFFGASLRPPRVGFVTEFCSNGEILDFFQKYREDHSQVYPMKEKLRMCKEIISSVDYIHSRNVIHRDIKSENVLIDSSEKTKLMDFGISRIVEAQESNLTKNIGTCIYIAPEVLSGVYDEKCDVFSFAILLWVIFTENGKPYGEKEHNVQFRVSNNPSFRPDLDEISFVGGGYEWIKKVIEKCWNADSNYRYSFKELDIIFQKEIVSDVVDEEEKTNINISESEIESVEELIRSLRNGVDFLKEISVSSVLNCEIDEEFMEKIKSL